MDWRITRGQNERRMVSNVLGYKISHVEYWAIYNTLAIFVTLVFEHCNGDTLRVVSCISLFKNT